MYKVRKYLPRMDPLTPMKITHHILRSNFICRKIMIVQAGGRGKGRISTSIEKKKTRK